MNKINCVQMVVYVPLTEVTYIAMRFVLVRHQAACCSYASSCKSRDLAEAFT
jgi:hypothetical protein